jgi:predicted DNA-binding transcriptional regulator AlpA
MHHVTPYPRFVRLGKPVQQLYGISRSTQYNLINQGKLRAPRKISAQLQGWLREELEEDLFGTTIDAEGGLGHDR